MTQFHPTPLATPRPNAATVVAIVGIVFAVFGLMCNVAGVVQSAMPAMGYDVGGEEMARAVAETPRWAIAFNVAQSGIGFVIWLLWITVCIALLRDATWARRWGVRTAVIHSVALVTLTIVGLIVTYSMKDLTVERMREHNARLAAQQATSQPLQQGSMNVLTERFALGVMFGGLACGFVFGAVLPVWMWIVMRRPDVIGYYDGENTEATPGYFPPPAPPVY